LIRKLESNEKLLGVGAVSRFIFIFIFVDSFSIFFLIPEKPREIYIPPPPPETEDDIFLSTGIMQKGINFDKYDDIPVECTGNNAPKRGASTFEEMGLSEILLKNVRRAKYDRPTPIQKWAIPIILSGRDVMGCAQTGSGKTAAFLLPTITGMLRDNLV
jgi:probable ATP-dependent RNA helicase DDX4